MKIVRLPDGTANLVLVGPQVDAAQIQGLKPPWNIESLGFVPSASGRTLMHIGADLLIEELLDVFPEMIVKEIPATKTWARIKALPSESVEMVRNDVDSDEVATDLPDSLEPSGENFALRVTGYGKDAQGRDAVFGVRLDNSEEVTVVLRPDPHAGKRLHPRPEIKDFVAEVGEVSALFEYLSTLQSSSLRQAL